MTDGVTIRIGTVFELSTRGTKATLAMIGAALVFSGVPMGAVLEAIRSII